MLEMNRRVAVIHPDLGVGGAERLIVDVSKALQDEGHFVDVYTAYHDEARCFEETKDGTLKVMTIGKWIPRTIVGHFHALMAYVKMIFIAIYLLTFSKSYDLIFCDQVSACIPIFRLQTLVSRKRSKIVFYCHFPDQLLTSRDSFIKKIYRFPLDRFEEWSTGLADVILVNSEFTSRIVSQTFKTLKDRQLVVLYPCVDINKFFRTMPAASDCELFKKRHNNLSNAQFTLLSINRFERKKNLALAIRAFGSLKDLLRSEDFDRYQLVIAGGYDERLEDCVQYYKELEELISSCSLRSNVTLLKSPNDFEKLILLKICDALIYTPQNEHFGIVPIEAMAMSKPVIALASGGPLETIEHNISGLLCEPNQVYYAIHRLISEPGLCKQMGKAGCENVIRRFSYETFRDKLNRACFSQISQFQMQGMEQGDQRNETK